MLSFEQHICILSFLRITLNKIFFKLAACARSYGSKRTKFRKDIGQPFLLDKFVLGLSNCYSLKRQHKGDWV